MSGVVCPQCGHDDRIQKVQAAVVGGISEMRSSGGFGGITYSGDQWGTFGGSSATRGTASTLLAQRLMPPDEPKVRYLGRWAWSFMPESFHEWYHFKIEPLWNGCGLIAFSVLSILLVLGAVGGLISGNSGGAASVFCGAAFCGVFALYISRRRGSYSKEKERLAAERALWEQAMSRWAGLYYCFRDDIVFDPETGEWCHPADLHEFLYAGLRE
mgnify:CR=1 FL=1